MKKIIISAVILMVSFIALAYADISLKAEVDKARISADETLTYKLIITSSEKQIPKPQLPKFEGFNVVSQAQSSTVSFVQSGIKTILVYAFILVPTNKGKFKISPSTIKIKNKTYSTDAFEIEVTQGKSKPKSKPKTKPQAPSLPEVPQPETESEQPQITL